VGKCIFRRFWVGKSRPDPELTNYYPNPLAALYQCFKPAPSSGCLIADYKNSYFSRLAVKQI